MQRSILGRATLVVVVVVATIALTSETSFSETLRCRTSPGAAAPPGTHWYYRVDRTNNRHCWYTQAAGLPVYSRRNGMPSTPTLHIARERISAPLISAPLQTDPTELSQLETAKADSTDTLTPSVDEPTASVEKPTANFTTRWSDLPKSVDLDQDKSTTRDNDASEPAASDSTKPVASTGFVSAGSKREIPQKSASAVYFWSIFLAGTLSTLLFGGMLKLARWLYSSVAWGRRTPNDYAETNPSELVRALRRVDESFNTPRSFSPSGAVTDVPANQEAAIRRASPRVNRAWLPTASPV